MAHTPLFLNTNTAGTGGGGDNRSRVSKLIACFSILALVLPSPGVARSLGGKTQTYAPSAAAIEAAKAAEAAAKAASAAKETLNRASLTIQARESAQQAVRDAAQLQLQSAPSGIPSGLTIGGMEVGPGADWIGGGAPTQWTHDGRTKVEIEQTQERGIFSWKTFNISEKTDVKFDQQGNRDWIALNRVLDPNMAPSRILGSITADGTVLVINQNGIVFGGGAQVNVGSIYASTLEVGPDWMPNPVNPASYIHSTIDWRTQNFLVNGLLGYGLPSGQYVGAGNSASATFSAPGGVNSGTVSVEEGAFIAAGENGTVLLTAPHVVNAGHLKAVNGQVILTAAELALTLSESKGEGTDPIRHYDFNDGSTPFLDHYWAAPDADVRGLIPLPQGTSSAASNYYVWNTTTGLIEAPQGNIYMRSPGGANFRTAKSYTDTSAGGVTIGTGAVYNDGILSATTSVSRNGSVMLQGDDVRMGGNSLISILADAGGETIPQSPSSIADFKPSAVKIGSGKRTLMEDGALLLAPGANVLFAGAQDLRLESGAEINVAGLPGVVVPISESQVIIDPAKQNELRDSPIYRLGFLNGETIYLDPRKSGVRDDGIAWIGSPLIDAQAYYELVGVKAERLMIEGGTVQIGSISWTGTPTTGNFIFRDGAKINLSGGWLSYDGGIVRSTKLVDSNGSVVDIVDADPSRTYVAIAGGFTRSNARWGVAETWNRGLSKSGGYYVSGYDEGRDAGVLSMTVGVPILDGQIVGNAYAGVRQIAAGLAGSGKSSVAGDERHVQGASSELPAGAALIINGGRDIRVVDELAPLADGTYGQYAGGTISSEGVYTPPTASTNSPLPIERTQEILLSDDLLSNSGLSQVSLLNSIETPSGSPALTPSTRAAYGAITVDAGAHIVLNPGGVFRAEGTRVQVDGDITAESGTIALRTDPGIAYGHTYAPGDFDVVVNGDLSVAGRWVNDLGLSGNAMLGPGWLNGGTISMEAAPKIVITATGNVLTSAQDPSPRVTDISGSIIINEGAHLNLSGGGRVNPNGSLNLAAKGGNLSLKSAARYWDNTASGFRVWETDGFTQYIATNPDRINARIVFDPASIDAHGFGGGGKFSLFTPEFSFGEGTPTTGARLSLDFFSQAGFGDYEITSYKTEFSPSTFTNGYGGYNATLATQTLTIGAGQTLNLVQSVLPNFLGSNEIDALHNLASGGDLNSVVSASVPVDAYDQKAVNLKLGGMMELHVAEGGNVVGAAGSALTVGGLINDGTIRIAGGSVTQKLELPSSIIPDGPGQANQPIAFRDLSEIFTVNSDGTIDPGAPSKIAGVTNEELVGHFAVPSKGRRVYKLGMLDKGQGIVLGENSVTDLSGALLINPRALGGKRPITDGRVVGGGTLATAFSAPLSIYPYVLPNYGYGGSLTAESGALIDLSGVGGVLDRLDGSGGYSPTAVWSDAGTLRVTANGTLAGATIHADGGSDQARGGTLEFANLVLSQHDPAAATQNVVSADMISAAGFDTVVAYGSVTSLGDADVKLDRAFFLQTLPWKFATSFSGISNLGDQLSPVIGSGGDLTIEAPYIGLNSVVDAVTPANSGTPNVGNVILKAHQIDVTGAVRFDRSVASAALEASGDIRLTGVPSTWNWTAAPADNPTLAGGLAARNDIHLTAVQIYPTTGSTFRITSDGVDGKITIARASGDVPPVPYSAGGNLVVQAAHIVQSGVVRVPLGALTLGSNSPLTIGTGAGVVLAPATQSVLLASGSVTSVSAGGLSIPYGTTTDTKEWYFAPTGLQQLSGPPQKILKVAGDSITLASGATVDLTGGGDVYAYEFVPGTGGSRDILSRFNADEYSGNFIGGVGYQYADARQVYAIVPGLSDAPAAAYDPLYSADYAGLSSAAGVGRRVYLSGANGLKAGWYTLLPAQYAMLPGGMRVVEQTGVKNVLPNSSTERADGSLLVSGYYGDALSGAYQSDLRQFNVMSQKVVKSYSNIVLTSGNAWTYANAEAYGLVAPRTGLDAGRLVLNPAGSMTIDTVVMGHAAEGGRGSQVDIGGARIEIVSNAADAIDPDAVRLTVASLNNLNAESLLIGGTRTDNVDGTTNLQLTANSIVVANDAGNPLVAPEIVFAVDDGITNPVGSRLVLEDGATVIATGELSDKRAGSYIIDGSVFKDTSSSDVYYRMPSNTAIGALFRVSNGPQRVVQRLRTDPDPTLQGNTGSPTGPDASLIVGNVNVKGAAIGLDTSHNVTLGSAAILQARDIALGVTRLAFTDAAAPAGTVVITPELQSILAQADKLTLRSQTSIGFDDGTYDFGSVAFDAATLESLQGGVVKLAVAQLQFSNSGAAATAAAGTGTLQVSADEILIGSGTVATSGFAGTVGLTATKGIFAAGQNGVFDVGASDLAIVTPYVGDRGRKGIYTDAATSMALRATGNVTIATAGGTVDVASIPGIPGSSVTVAGNEVAISGTHMRATAGALTIRAAGAITLAGGAELEAPGYSQTFGDTADPQTKSAPGGSLTLAALGAGGIALGDAHLSVGNGNGNAGTLKLSAANGAIAWGTAVLDGRGATAGEGGTFSIDTRGAIDLVALNARVGANGFTGGFEARTLSGDIVLGSGQRLRSGSVSLTADGGSVVIGGTIDTSGVNGGDIALYGTGGVTLQGSALLDAHAEGYPSDDTRQARAGDVTLGTDFVARSTTIGSDGVVSGTSGAIRVASGARIDASAKRPGDRLVRIMRNGVVNYAFVEGDKGGSVTVRGPVYANSLGRSTVDVAIASAGSVIGAEAIDLVGFKRWDLDQVAASGLYKGVAYDAATDTVTIDVAQDLDTANLDGSMKSVGGINFLGDNGAGTVVDFVQNFDVSASYGNLGGLASQANFHARPGVDLAATANITLKSNWNLGAGTVDLASAAARGYASLNSTLAVAGVPTSGYVIKPDFEDEVFDELTKFTYRTKGGNVRGEAPVVGLRAGGDLTLNGGITDGFFTFRDQSDKNYRALVGQTYRDYQMTLNGGFSAGGFSPLTSWSTWTGTSTPANYLGLGLGTQGAAYVSAGVPLGATTVPYTAAANSPAALGTYSADALGNVDGGGDPISSGVVFPLLPDGTVVRSSDYALAAGADLGGGSVARASVDPTRLNLASAASLVVQGLSTYRPPAGTYTTSKISGGLGVDQTNSFTTTAKPSSTDTTLTIANWLADITAPFYTGVSETSVALVYLGSTAANSPNRGLVLQLFGEFAQAHGLQRDSTDPNVGWRYSSLTATDATTTFIAMSVKNFKAFVTEKLAPNEAQLTANLSAAIAAPSTTTSVAAKAATLARPLIRTGTGNIQMAASGNVDLTNGAPVYVNRTGQIVATNPAQCGFNPACGAQLGGVPVYTAGHRAAPISEVLPDPIDPSIRVQVSTPAQASSVFNTPLGYTYTNGTYVIADTFNLTGGGDIDVVAAESVLSRRDFSNWIFRINSNSTYSPAWLGASTQGVSTFDNANPGQPWRVVSMDYYGVPKATINPQAFFEGIGTLGGGDISIAAGGAVSDLSTVIDTSLTSLKVTPSGSSLPTNVLVTVGGGNLSVEAAGDIISARADVASGTLSMQAGGSITAGDLLPAGSNNNYRYRDLNNVLRVTSVPVYATNESQVRITDATVNLAASGDIALRGITQLDGFYSDASSLNLLAGGSVAITNTLQTRGSWAAAPGQDSFAIYPGTLTVAALTGDIDMKTFAPPLNAQVFNNEANYAPDSYNPYAPNAILMVPSAKGQLSILASGDVGATSLAMLDMDPYYLPGLYTLGGALGIKPTFTGQSYPNDGYQWGSIGFPGWKSTLTDQQLKWLHTAVPTHTGDDNPIYFYAGNDIGNDVIGAKLSLPKQARIYAGRDILNMMLFGQNLTDTDVTRVVAGRDIVGKSQLGSYTQYIDGKSVVKSQPLLFGNTFVLGGPGDLVIEAGRDLGPFLNSAQLPDSTVYSNPPMLTYPGGILSVGNSWNPYLDPGGADITVLFGVGKGADYHALRDNYVAPGAPHTLGDYGTKLVGWMQEHASDTLVAQFGTTNVGASDAYAAYLTLPEVRQRLFLTDVVYFGELRAPAEADGPSYLKFSRGYTAVNTLFPSELGYTKNALEGGAKSDAIVHTGDIDLRLAAIESLYGGDINILGPGGRVLGGSTVATSQQAARRYYGRGGLFATPKYLSSYVSPIVAIPSGYEGVLTQRGGHINTFTDGDFILNQSRLFTVLGGDITMWSSNADLNAGQGAKTTPNFPPINIRIDANAISTDDRTSATSGAGIAAYPPKPGEKAPDVYLLAPRGTVDAGDAGVRVAGNLSVVAEFVANADNFKVSGVSIGIPSFVTPDSGALTTASNTAAAVADAGPDKNAANAQPSVIIVEVLGFGGGDGDCEKQKDGKRNESCP